MAETGTGSRGMEPKLTDDRIVAIIDYGIAQSVGFSESKLSKERARVQEFYDAERPFKQHKGDSSYVSDDVYQGIENMGAQLLDVFAANGRPVKFEPVKPGDDAEADIRTDYVTDVIFRQNPGYSIFRDTINEGLLARASVCKAWWENKTKTVYKDLSQLAHDEIIAWLEKQPDAKIVEKDIDEDTGAIKRFQVSYEQDVSQVRIKQLAGEEFGISPMAETIETADLVFHRHEMTVSDLLKAGYDKKVVEDLQSNDRLWMAMEPEKISRFMPTDDLIGTKVLEDGQNARRVIMVYECYLELDMDGSDKSQLYKVTKVSNTILDKEPVDRKPFIAFIPLPRPNAFWGHNYAKKLEHVQTAKSYLTRGVVNHVLVTNNPKIIVKTNSVANPREIMENRLGGIVNAKDPAGIVPMPQLPMNPYVFQTLQLLDQQKQESTGISSLSQGLNHDAISKQNSGDMIHELITVSQLRQKIVARNFAENFLAPLYTEVYLLLLENGTAKEDVKFGEKWASVDPSQWPDKVTCDVSFALGYGEQEREAMKWAQVGAALEKDPMLAPWYTPEQHYWVAQKALEARGIKSINSVLRPLQSPLQPPPDPLKQAEIAMKQADAASKNAQAQTSQMAQQIALKELESKTQIELARIELERLKVMATISQNQDKLAHQVTVDSVEMGLQMQAAAAGKVQANPEPK
jgi:hypothetical protein